MLENLRAQDEVEARIVDRQCLDGSDQVGRRILDDIDADVARSDISEERVVRLDAAADVEDAHRATLELRGLFAQPPRERRPDDPGR